MLRDRGNGSQALAAGSEDAEKLDTDRRDPRRVVAGTRVIAGWISQTSTAFPGIFEENTPLFGR